MRVQPYCCVLAEKTSFSSTTAGGEYDGKKQGISTQGVWGTNYTFVLNASEYAVLNDLQIGNFKGGN